MSAQVDEEITWELKLRFTGKYTSQDSRIYESIGRIPAELDGSVQIIFGPEDENPEPSVGDIVYVRFEPGAGYWNGPRDKENHTQTMTLTPCSKCKEQTWRVYLILHPYVCEDCLGPGQGGTK